VNSIEANPLYSEAVRLFSYKKPLVAAVQGPAIGGWLGLALVAEFPCSVARSTVCGELHKNRNPSRLRPHLHITALTECHIFRVVGIA